MQRKIPLNMLDANYARLHQKLNGILEIINGCYSMQVRVDFNFYIYCDVYVLAFNTDLIYSRIK